MNAVRNVLFIMCDQLRAEYLGCNGHMALKTRNIDWLASRGVNFKNAFAQAPVCGPSRMSFYSGRYVLSHGATWNGTPLRADELTMAHVMRDLGLRSALIGKSHIRVEPEALKRLGVDTSTPAGSLIAQGGFEPVERDDGIHRDSRVRSDLPYNEYLRANGYGGTNPWHEHANSAEGPNGELLSGWQFRNSVHPARVAAEHSETAYMTDRAIDFIRGQGDERWFLHLSYIKPHWPYMAPAPYHRLYGEADIQPVVRSPQEVSDPHPILKVMMSIKDSRAFQEDRTRRAVVPTYMGLVHQIDDNLGRLFRLLEELGRFEDTMIVFTSDHGDHLGDHWLADKALFYEASIRIPLIVFDPRKSAEATRNTVNEDLVESIDVFPTFIDAVGGAAVPERLEGISLDKAINGRGLSTRRQAVFSELDYAYFEPRIELGLPLDRANGRMVRTRRWKYAEFQGLPPQLFDLAEDPDEFRDLGTEAEFGRQRAELSGLLHDWSLSRKNRVADTQERIENWLSDTLGTAGKSAW